MTGSVTINGVTYTVVISDLTPAEVLNVFRTDTSVIRTDSILLHSAGAGQNSAKKVLLPHLISAVSSALAEDIALTVEPYYDDTGTYRGMFWHYNRDWLRRADTGEMIRVDDPAAAAALSADAANDAAAEAKGVVREWTRSGGYKAQMDTALDTADIDHNRAGADHSTADADHTTAAGDHTQATADHTTAEGDHSRAGTDHDTAAADHTTAGRDHTQAAADHTTATTDHTTAEGDHTQAAADHTASTAATTAATNVNADLEGMTVTITNRQGVTKSVNIGFEILEDNVYASVEEMVADAANVRKGAFCMIATTDPTSADNAQLWSRNSSAPTGPHPFTFLSDLDQASSAAFADWLDNYKPVIEADHTRAESDHTTAAGDHTQAGADHTQATADHTASTTATAAATAEADRAKAYNDHPWSIGSDGYIYVWDETHDNGDGTYGAMVRTNKMIIDFSDLTEAQKQSMARAFYDTITVASAAECEAAADELT